MTEEQMKKEGATADTAAQNPENTTPDCREAPESETFGKDADKKKSRGEKQLADENKQLTTKTAELTLALDKAQSELEETRDKYLRVCAEYDNFRKRSTKERDGLYADAYADALKEILPILDNLERAALYTEADKLTDGLALIFKSAKDALEKLGVEAFGASGDQFDPLIHNAVMHADDENAGANEIVEVFQRGYKKGDRIIRHAMVKVVN